MKTETAVSDLIAAMTLIAVFVTAAAILGVAILSIQPGDAAPAMIARSVVTDDGVLSIRHDGGDPLVKGHFKILVDGVDRTDNFSIDGNSGWTSWETGQLITFDGELPEGAHVQITGEGVSRTGSDWLLHGIPTAEQIQVPLIADFIANVTSGSAPLTVQFIDTSTGEPTSWLWNFGDGNTSTEQNPVHTYVTAGNYTVTLTASNAYGSDNRSREDYIRVKESFVDFVIDENVFVYGTALQFSGSNVNGPGATIIVTGGLTTSDLNGGASVNVSNIYIDGDVTLDGGSAGLGSPTEPGSIYINGDLELWRGQRHIYGDVYVNGNFRLKDARIHGNVYVDGDLTLGNTPWLAEEARIYYTGNITSPKNYDSNYATNIIAKCIHQTTVPGFTIPDQGIPSTKSDDWYAARGYVSGGALTGNLKVFAPSYSSTSGISASNVIIIASTGDISITGGWSTVTGVFFAPNGTVTFNGASLEGIVIARDGFDVTSGGTTVTFKNVEEYISNPADYPF